MKSFIIALALVAVAAASPVLPGAAGPAAVLDKYEPVVVGPALIDTFEPIVVGPALVDNYQPIAVGPAVVDSYQPIVVGPAIIEEVEQIAVGPAIVEEAEQIAVGPAIVAEPTPQAAPLVQIILNINEQTHVVDVPLPIAPTPVVVVEEASVPEMVPEVVPAPAEVIEASPVQVVEAVPAEVGTPILPTPVINLPDELN